MTIMLKLIHTLWKYYLTYISLYKSGTVRSPQEKYT